MVIGTVETVASMFFEPVDWALTARDCLGGNCSPLVGISLLPFVPGSLGRQLNKYDVGLFSDLKKASRAGDDLALHHAPQNNPASQVIPNYDPLKGPAITLPTNEHIAINSANIIGPYIGTARNLMAKTINDLRAFTNAPNSALWQLLNLFNQTYPGVLGK